MWVTINIMIIIYQRPKWPSACIKEKPSLTRIWAQDRLQIFEQAPTQPSELSCLTLYFDQYTYSIIFIYK